MTRPGAAPLLRMLLAQTRSELLMRWRVPAFSLTSLALPVVFFTFFGLPLVNQTAPDGTNLGAFVLASFAAYAVGSIMVFSFGIGVATERAMRINTSRPVSMRVPNASNVIARTIASSRGRGRPYRFRRRPKAQRDCTGHSAHAGFARRHRVFA